MKATVKFIGASGQISLGKEYAGRRILVEEPEPGVWLVRTATVVPDNERWLHTPEAKKALGESLAWAVATPARASDLSEFKKTLNNGEKPPASEELSKSTRRARFKQPRVSKKLVLA